MPTQEPPINPTSGDAQGLGDLFPGSAKDVRHHEDGP
jgi:hypothetical protein